LHKHQFAFVNWLSLWRWLESLISVSNRRVRVSK